MAETDYAIACDATCDLPASFLGAAGVEFADAPLDGDDLGLATDAFERTYRSLASRGLGRVVSLHSCATYSPLVEAARAAARRCAGEVEVAVIDSGSASVATGMLVDRAARYRYFDVDFTDAVAALKEFCALRTQSLQGQLDGTIPSTDQGQQEDPQALVDTAGLTLSDMGSMNVGGMGGFGQRGEAGDGGQMTLGRGRLEGLSQSDLQTRIEQSGEETAPSGQESGEETAPFDREAWTPPEGVSLESGTSAGSWTLLGAAAALLAAGIALAARYRRRI